MFCPCKPLVIVEQLVWVRDSNLKPLVPTLSCREDFDTQHLFSILSIIVDLLSWNLFKKIPFKNIMKFQINAFL